MHRLGHQLRLEAVCRPAGGVRCIGRLPWASQARLVQLAERRFVARVCPVFWLFGADGVRARVEHLQVLANKRLDAFGRRHEVETALDAHRRAIARALHGVGVRLRIRLVVSKAAHHDYGVAARLPVRQSRGVKTVQDNRVGRQVQSGAVVCACLVAAARGGREGRAQGVRRRAEQPLDAIADAVAVFVAVAGDQLQFVDARLRAPPRLHDDLQRLHGRVEGRARGQVQLLDAAAKRPRE
jgi:hypothetical protein